MASFSGFIRSKELNMDTWVQVVGPDGTRKSDRPRKVIYMIHGTTGNSSNWVQLTRLPLYAVEHNVMFILPEVENSWCRNIPDRGNFFNYIVDELPEIMGGLLNISSKREEVAIMGNSSGAFGALKCALSRPEQYGLCCGFSTASVHLGEYLAYLRSQKPEEMENPQLRSVYGPNLESTDDDELLKLAEKVSRQAVQPKIYMSIGRQDFLFEPNETFSNEMKALPLDYTYETFEGSHDWRFWDAALERVLNKYYPIRQ